MLIYGKNPVMDLYKKSPKVIKKFYVDLNRHKDFLNQVDSKLVFPISDIKGKHKIMQEVHQGIIAEIDDPKQLNILELIEITKKRKNKTIIILDRINDPHNLGAIMRSVSAFNGAGIISSIHESAGLTPGALKSSAGTWMNVNFVQVNNLSNAIKTLKENDYWIASAIMNGKETLEDIKNFDRPLAIIVGNEGSGVKKTLILKSDLTVSIPMKSNTESLNVSVAAGIILFIMK